MSLLTVILLLICTCTYVRSIVPSLLDNRLGKVGVLFGNVPELERERVHMWQPVASLWLSAYYSGHEPCRYFPIWPVCVLYIAMGVHGQLVYSIGKGGNFV